MIRPSAIIRAERPDGTRLFACVDPRARFCLGQVADVKLGALLSPFVSAAGAEAALIAAGAVMPEGGAK